MKKIGCILLLFGGVGFFTSCKSEFEKVRTSNDPAFIYQKAQSYYEAEEYQKAQSLYELAIAGYRGKKEAEDISFKYAYTFYHLGSYIMAAYHFGNFSKTFSTSPNRQESDFMVAYSNYQLSPSYRLDQSYSQEAVSGFQLFVNTYPDSDRVQLCNRLIDELRKKQEIKELENGKLYFDLRQYRASIHTFENLLKDFPETENAPYVRYLIVEAYYSLASNSVVDKKLQRYEETKVYANEFIDKFGETEFGDEVKELLDKTNSEINKLSADDRYKNESSGS